MVLIIFKSENCSYTGDPPTSKMLKNAKYQFKLITLSLNDLIYSFIEYKLNYITLKRLKKDLIQVNDIIT